MSNGKTIQGVEVFLTILPDSRAVAAFCVNGLGVAFPLESVPDLIVHLQEMVTEGPEVVASLRKAIAMGDAVGGVN